MADDKQQVIVVGAGPVGMSAALALHARGLPVKVLERDPEDRRRVGSRAIYLHGTTLHTLERNVPGLGKDLAEAGLVWPTRRTTFRGKEVFSRTYKTPGGSGGLPHFTSLPQQRTEAILFEHCKKTGIEFIWEAEVEKLTTSDDGVKLETKKGDVYEAAYVIGADGSRSNVRNLIGAEFEGSRSVNSYLIADVKEVEENPLPLVRDFHYEHPAVEGRNVLIVPFKGGWRVDLQCEDDDDPEAMCEPEQVSDWIAKTLGERYRDRVDWVSSYQFLQVIANSFIDKNARVLLVGEAAHLFAPFGARGMNSGVADADAAASSIALALQAKTPALAKHEIEQFNQRRRDAAISNTNAAGQALDHLRADNPITKLKRRAAAAIAPVFEKAGKWLDEAPYGPPDQTKSRIGSKY